MYKIVKSGHYCIYFSEPLFDPIGTPLNGLIERPNDYHDRPTREKSGSLRALDHIDWSEFRE